MNKLQNIKTAKEYYDALSTRVIGQEHAKRAVAVALHSRELNGLSGQTKGIPNNILLKGPTGSGKTEILRTLQSELGLPVETIVATNITPPGYVGEDIQDVIKRLYDNFDVTSIPEWYLDDLERRKEYDLIPEHRRQLRFLENLDVASAEFTCCGDIVDDYMRGVDIIKDILVSLPYQIKIPFLRKSLAAIFPSLVRSWGACQG